MEMWLVIIYRETFPKISNQYESMDIIFRALLHCSGVEDVRLLEQGLSSHGLLVSQKCEYSLVCFALLT